jgi:hypothetical protein
MDDIVVVVTERFTAVLSYTVLHGRSTSEQQAMMAAVSKHHCAYQMTSTDTKFKDMLETLVY